MPFADHFSDRSPAYAQFRPRYPDALFEWVASMAPRRSRVWDCGTGTGQAATALARHFDLVVATDASGAQLAHAPRDAAVRYVQTLAEASGLATRSVDAVTVAQAIHWFDLEAFYLEVRRVARPGALVAAWTYGNPSVDERVDPVLEHFYRDVVGACWPPERRMIERMYEDVRLPFEPVDPPAMSLEMAMTRDALAGYIDTWSAVRRYRAERAGDPMPALVDALAAVWPDAAAPRTTRWPMAIRAGRV